MAEAKVPNGVGDGNATLSQPPPIEGGGKGEGDLAAPRDHAMESAYTTAPLPSAPRPDDATALARTAALHRDLPITHLADVFHSLYRGLTTLAEAKDLLATRFPNIPPDKFEWLLSLKGRGDITGGSSLLEMFQQYDFACKTESEVPAYAAHVPDGEIPTLTPEEEEFFLTHRMFNFTLYAARRALAVQTTWRWKQQGRNFDRVTVFAPGGTHRFVQAILLTDATTLVIVDPEESLTFKYKRLEAIGAVNGRFRYRTRTIPAAVDGSRPQKKIEVLEYTFSYRGKERKIIQYMHDVFDPDFWPRELEKGIDAYYEVFFRSSLMLNGFAPHYDRYNAQVVASLKEGALLLGDDSIHHLTGSPNPFTGGPSVEEEALGLERFVTPHPSVRPGMSDFPTYAATAKDPITKERASPLMAAFKKVAEATYELIREIYLEKADVELKGDGYHLTTAGEVHVREKIVANLKAIGLGLKDLTGEEIDTILEWIEKDHPTWFPRSMGVSLSDDGFRDIRRQSEPLRKRAQEILEEELPKLHEALTGYSFVGPERLRIRTNAANDLVEKVTGTQPTDEALIVVHPLRESPLGDTLGGRTRALIEKAERDGIPTILLKERVTEIDRRHQTTLQIATMMGDFDAPFVSDRATFVGGNVFGCLTRALWSTAEKAFQAEKRQFSARIIADSSWQSDEGRTYVLGDRLAAMDPRDALDYLNQRFKENETLSSLLNPRGGGRPGITIILNFRGTDQVMAQSESGRLLRIEIVDTIPLSSEFTGSTPAEGAVPLDRARLRQSERRKKAIRERIGELLDMRFGEIGHYDIDLDDPSDRAFYRRKSEREIRRLAKEMAELEAPQALVGPGEPGDTISRVGDEIELLLDAAHARLVSSPGNKELAIDVVLLRGKESFWSVQGIILHRVEELSRSLNVLRVELNDLVSRTDDPFSRAMERPRRLEILRKAHLMSETGRELEEEKKRLKFDLPNMRRARLTPLAALVADYAREQDKLYAKVKPVPVERSPERKMRGMLVFARAAVAYLDGVIQELEKGGGSPRAVQQLELARQTRRHFAGEIEEARRMLGPKLLTEVPEDQPPPALPSPPDTSDVVILARWVEDAEKYLDSLSEHSDHAVEMRVALGHLCDSILAGSTIKSDDIIHVDDGTDENGDRKVTITLLGKRIGDVTYNDTGMRLVFRDGLTLEETLLELLDSVPKGSPTTPSAPPPAGPAPKPARLRPDGFHDHREFAAATGREWHTLGSLALSVIPPPHNRPQRGPLLGRAGASSGGLNALSSLPRATLVNRDPVSGFTSGGNSGKIGMVPATGSLLERVTRGRDDMTGGDDGKESLRDRLISEARERGYSEVAQILIHMNDDQTARLMARVAEWRKILERKGEGSMVSVVASWSRTDQTLFTLAVLLNRKADVERVTRAFRIPLPGNRPAGLPPAMALPAGSGQVIQILR